MLLFQPDVKPEVDSAIERAVRRAAFKCADLLRRPGAWTKGRTARDRCERPIDARHRKAVSFCALGAMVRVGVLDDGGPDDTAPYRSPVPANDALIGEMLVERMIALLGRAAPTPAEFGGEPMERRMLLADWNDATERTQPQVVELFYRAAREVVDSPAAG